MSGRRNTWILAALFVAMATLQLGLAGRHCLWVDEVFSLAIATGHSLEHPAAAADPARGDFVEPNGPVQAKELQRYLKHEQPPASPKRVIRAILLSDTSPPLYYLLLYVWTLIFGTSDVLLRLFSITWSLACFPLVASVARRTGGSGAVIPACLLFALSPLGLYFSGEARMYSLLLFCVLATAALSLALYEGGGHIILYLSWIAASAAGFLTHYFFLFPWLAMVIYLLLLPGKLQRWRLVVCASCVGLAILPWYVLAASAGGHWRITEGWLYLRPSGFSLFRAIRNQFLQFFSSGGSGLWKSERWSNSASIVLFCLVAGAMAWRLRLRMFAGPRLLVWLWFILACAAPTVMDLLGHTYFTNNPRYALAALPAAYLLAAMAVSSLGKRAGSIMCLLILLSWAVPVVNIYRQRSRCGQPFLQVAKSISSSGDSSDLILVHSIPSGVLGVARYANPTSMVSSWVQQLGTRRMPESLQTLIGGQPRIYYVLAHPLGEPAPEDEWLRSNAMIVREMRMERLKVVEFRPKNAATF